MTIASGRSRERESGGDGDAGSLAARRLMAWGVHLFTASGAVCCLLAADAAIGERWRAAFAWLAAATLVDSLDGSLARRIGVKELLPGFDGTLLDNVVDFLGYVFVPALILHQAGLVPPAWSLWLAGAVCVASSFQFCQADAKTGDDPSASGSNPKISAANFTDGRRDADHHFKGFPSYWNVAILYLLALRLSQEANATILVVLIALVFVPIRYVYPSRTATLRKTTLALTIAWGLTIAVIIFQLPRPDPRLVSASLLYVVYYFAVSVYLTHRTFTARRTGA